MNGPSGMLKQEFSTMLTKAIKATFPNSSVSREQVDATVTVPKAELGDLSSSICLRLAREMKANPNSIAETLIKKLKASDHIKELKAMGGYINAWADEKAYSQLVIEAITDEGDAYGAVEAADGKKVIVESPAVNPNKPWHIGQLRNALLGDVISNIYEACGYKVEREDYIDDLGLQIAESLWGYMNVSNKPTKKADQWFGEQYVQVNKVMEGKDLMPELNALLKKMEDHGTREAKLGKEIAEMCVRAQYETAFSYGIFHDVLIWESDIVRERMLDKAIEMAEKKGALKRPNKGKYAGCVVVDLSGSKEFKENEETVKVLLRNNGVPTYIAKDLAFHMWKFGLVKNTFKYSKFMAQQPNGKPLYTTSASGEDAQFGNVKRAINIIGSEQKYEQSVLRKIFEMMGLKDVSDNIIHLAYGLVSVESGSLSGRTGGWIGQGRNYTADDLLREVKEKAKSIVMQSEKITDKSNADAIAKAVAIAAIKFEYLRVSPEKEVVFSWDKALNFEGNSGPYCMYTYARASRILEKGSVYRISLGKSDYSQVTRGKDHELMKFLGTAPEVVEKACREHKPNAITEYLLELSALFSSFYEAMPVLKGGDAKNVRLAMVSATRQVTKNMLGLLGIEPVSTM